MNLLINNKISRIFLSSRRAVNSRDDSNNRDPRATAGTPGMSTAVKTALALSRDARNSRDNSWWDPISANGRNNIGHRRVNSNSRGIGTLRAATSEQRGWQH
jgi:hypothetical protein